MPISVTNITQVVREKLEEEKKIFESLFEVFPNHRIATPTHPYRSYYTTWICDHDFPKHTHASNGDIILTELGIIAPTPKDKRYKLFGWLPLGFLPSAELIANVLIEYKYEECAITSIKISVFGEENMTKIYAFAEQINSFEYEIKIELVDYKPRLENQSYQN